MIVISDVHNGYGYLFLYIFLIDIALWKNLVLVGVVSVSNQEKCQPQ